MIPVFMPICPICDTELEKEWDEEACEYDWWCNYCDEKIDEIDIQWIE